MQHVRRHAHNGFSHLYEFFGSTKRGKGVILYLPLNMINKVDLRSNDYMQMLFRYIERHCFTLYIVKFISHPEYQSVLYTRAVMFQNLRLVSNL